MGDLLQKPPKLLGIAVMAIDTEPEVTLALMVKRARDTGVRVLSVIPFDFSPWRSGYILVVYRQGGNPARELLGETFEGGAA